MLCHGVSLRIVLDMKKHATVRAVMTTTPDTTPPLLRPAEVADYLRVSRSTVYRLIASGELGTVHVGARRAARITREALDAYIAKNMKVRGAGLDQRWPGR